MKYTSHLKDTKAEKENTYFFLVSFWKDENKRFVYSSGVKKVNPKIDKENKFLSHLERISQSLLESIKCN
jgi:hypothetical protein